MAQDFSNDPNVIPPGPVESFDAPPPRKNNARIWIIVIVVVVLLCCCCLVAFGVYAWNNGDQWLRDLNIEINGFSRLISLLPL
jgi:hypothetical protein